MNAKFRTFTANIFRAVSVSAVRLLISVVLTLFLPKVLGIEEYSYWQLYQFYLTYIVYSSLGWCEGLYLKHGGKQYDELDRTQMSGQFWALALYELLFSVIVGTVLVYNVTGGNKQAAVAFAFVSAFLDILRYCLQSVLQTTNRIADYARVAIAERLLFFAFVIIALAIGRRDFRSLIYAELAARALTLLLAVFICRKVVLTRPPPPRAVLREAASVLRMGYKLLAAAFASQLIIGIVRFAIEQHWGTLTFGKVSLTLSLSNMVVTCIGAVGVVLFPMLKQTAPERLAALYGIARMATTLPILALLLFYTPISLLLGMWLPQYADSLKYLAILLPMCIYEARSFMLTDTYFKVYQQGGRILLVNAVSVVLSLAFTGLTVFLLNSLDAAMLSIVILVSFKSIFAELLLQKQLGRNAWLDILPEAALTWLFIAANWMLDGGLATLIYACGFGVYLVIRRRQLLAMLRSAKRLAGRTGGEEEGPTHG